MTVSQNDNWIERFPALEELPKTDRQFFTDHAKIANIPEGQIVFAPGSKPENFLLILKGTVKVQQVGANGREIILYRASAGESCIMTTTCLLADEDYLAEGVTETPVTAVVLNKSDFDAFMGLSQVFRRLVFSKYASRMGDLQKLVEDVAFERMDRRLVIKLLELSSDGLDIDFTHQALATELGTAREVVSRLLKELSDKGLISTGRGHVKIIDRAALANIAADS
ncbi:MAG: Crp/Fnr family transcriptional regulator [Rhodospirillales bacterium]|nr:Crp/Fnr family transcriptional regulator [Rhodospirillales bacterium]